MVKAAFLDRDKTLIQDKGYTFRTDDLIWEQDAIAGLAALHSIGYKLIVITNQSGIARGYYNEEEMNAFHMFMNNDLKQKEGIVIEKFYHCPHHPDGNIKKYSKNCDCRKPCDELFQKAILEFSIDTSQSIVIGNNSSDIIPAIKRGISSGFLLNDKKNKNPPTNYWPNILLVNNWIEIINDLNNSTL